MIGCCFTTISYVSGITVFLRFIVSCCPVLPEESDIIVFLRLLGIDWPTVPITWTNDEREENILEALQNSPYREREETDGGRRESEGKNTDGDKEEMLRVNLKRVFQEEQLPGYDPSLGSCTGETNNIDLLTWGLVVNVLTYE